MSSNFSWAPRFTYGKGFASGLNFTTRFLAQTPGDILLEQSCSTPMINAQLNGRQKTCRQQRQSNLYGPNTSSSWPIRSMEHWLIYSNKKNCNVLKPIVTALGPSMPQFWDPLCLAVLYKFIMSRLFEPPNCSLFFAAMVNNCPCSWGLFTAVRPRIGVYYLPAPPIAPWPTNPFLCCLQTMQRRHLVRVCDKRSNLARMDRCVFWHGWYSLHCRQLCHVHYCFSSGDC